MVFLFMFIGILVYQYNAGIADLQYQISLVAKGCIRNTFFAGGLWFLTCLFLIDLIFKALKLLNNRIVILGICTALSMMALTLINPSPLVMPHWFYNLDSALYYIFYYAVGYVVYPLILSLFQLDTLVKKCLFLLLFFLTFVYSVCVYAGSDYIYHVSALFSNEIIQVVFEYFRTLLLIGFFVFLSKFFENVDLFCKIGADTLFLCGNEYVIKSIVVIVLNAIGLGNYFTTPIHVFAYSFLLLLFGVFMWNPIQKKLYGCFTGIFHKQSF